jgi:RNA polymerase sigma-70 factor (ECF subfamily)
VPVKSAILEGQRHTDESGIVQLLQQQNEEGFNLLYRNYSGALYGVIKKTISDDDIASDLLQEIFIKIFRNIQKYDTVKGRLFTWMMNIARNHIVDFLRSSGNKQSEKNQNIEDSVNVINHNQHLETDTNTMGLRQWVERLPQKHSELIELIYFQGYTQQEASEILNLPLGTVKTRIRNGIGELKKIFGSEQ